MKKFSISLLLSRQTSLQTELSRYPEATLPRLTGCDATYSINSSINTDSCAKIQFQEVRELGLIQQSSSAFDWQWLTRFRSHLELPGLSR